MRWKDVYHGAILVACTILLVAMIDKVTKQIVNAINVNSQVNSFIAQELMKTNQQCLKLEDLIPPVMPEDPHYEENFYRDL